MNTAYPPQTHGNVTYPGPGQGGGALDLRGFLKGIWSRKKMIVFVVVAVSVLTGLYLVSLKPSYISESRLLISNAENVYTRLENTATQAGPADNQAVLSQVQILLSKDLALRAIKKLKLSQRQEFYSGDGSKSILSRTARLLGFSDSGPMISTEQRILDTFALKLVVFQVPTSRVIAVRFTSKDAELSAKAANAVAKLYIRMKREAKLKDIQNASKWLSVRVAELRRELKIAEKSVADFRAKAGLVRVKETTLNAQTLTALNTQINNAMAQKSGAQARVREIKALLLKDGGLITSPPTAAQSTLMTTLLTQRSTLRRQVSNLNVKYLPSHPRMVRISSEINGVEEQIRVEFRKIIAGLENQVRIINARESALLASLGRHKRRATIESKDRVKLQALERDAQAKRKLLESFLGRLRNATARQDVESQTPGARIISHAQIPLTPSTMKKTPLMIMAVIGSLLLGIILSFVAEIFAMSAPVGPAYAYPMPSAPPPSDAPPTPPSPPPSSRVRSILGAKANPPPSQASANMGNILGYLSQSYVDADHAIGADAQIFGSVVKAFEIYKNTTGANVILMVSDYAVQGDGAAIVDLARTLAGANYSVLLVDADFHDQTIANALRFAPGVGLADLLQGQSTFTDVILSDQVMNTHIMLAGSNPMQASSLLASGQMDGLLEALGEAYDFVLIAAGAISQSQEAQALASKVGSALLIAQNEGMAQGAAGIMLAAGQANTSLILREQPVGAGSIGSRLFS